MKLSKYAVIMTASLLMASAAPYAANAAEEIPTTSVIDEAPAAKIVDSGKINASVSWELDENGTVTVTGSGDMSRVDNTLESKRSRIKKAVIRNTSSEEVLTAIGNSLFLNCNQLTEVTLPDTITRIGSNAFSGCSALSTISFPASLNEIENSAFYNSGLTEITLPGCKLGTEAFRNSKSLVSVKIGEGTEIIPRECFRGCTALENAYLPDSVKEISASASDTSGAFYDCPALKNVSIGKSIETIPQYAFRTGGTVLEVTFREGVTAIPGSAFNGRTELKKLVLPSTLEKIGNSSFNRCSNLSVCEFPASLKEIGNSAFYGTALPKVSLPGCKLGTEAFMNSKSLVSVKIGEGTETIPIECFRGCTALESAYLPDSVKEISASASDTSGAFYDCPALKNVSIGKSIASIHQYAFRTGGTVLEVTFREGVTAIPGSAFYDRSELKKLVLPSTLEKIGNSSFSGCSNLSVCEFPASLKEIGENAFYGTALTKVTLPGCTLGAKAFRNCKSLVSVKIGEGTEIIPTECFRGCTALESAYLPDSVTELKATSDDTSGAFYDCPVLKKVSFGKSIKKIHYHSFRAGGTELEVTFREGATAVPDSAFNGRTELKKVVLPSTLEKIGSSSFYGCSSLSVCEFPASLKEIGSEAFYGTALTELYLPGCIFGSRAFRNCKSLVSVKIGEGTEIIPTECFRGCTALESAYLPDSVTELKATSDDTSGAFYDCPALKKVSFGKSIEKIHYHSFRSSGKNLEVTFREGVTAVPDSAFYDRSEVKKVVLPSTLEKVGSSSFSRCSNLSECEFPASLKEIGSEAFYGTALTELSLPGCKFGIRAFRECDALTKVRIGEGTETIPNECFRGCNALESVILPDSVKEITATSDNTTGAFYDCDKLKTVSIGKSINTIHYNTFRTGGKELEVTFREGVTAIPKNAFGSGVLTSLVLPETVKSLPSDIISAYSGLKRISVGAADCDIADSDKTIPSAALIVGYAKSSAQEYAEKYGRAFKSLEEEDPTIMYGSYITSVNLTLDGSIGINFFAKLKKGAEKVVLSGPDGDIVYSGDKLAEALLSDGRYRFSYGVNATQAGKDVVMRIYDAGGNQLDIYNSNFEKLNGKVASYSVNSYIADVSDYTDSPELSKMIKALDNYCKAAENFFCETSHQLVLAKANVVKTNSFNKKFKISLVLESRTALRIYSDAASAELITASGEHELTAVRSGKSARYFEIPEIYAQNLTDDITVKLDGVTYKICPMDYCALVLANKNSDKKLADVCTAIYHYGVAAKNYKNSTT